VFGSVLRFELAYWFKRPLTLLFFVLFFLLAFFSTASDTFLNVGGTGQIHRNAPFVLATAVAVLTAIGQIITTAIAGTSVVRDAQLGTQELLFTTRMSRMDYLGGRFAGAFLVMLVIYCALPIGLWVGMHMPWIGADTLGSTSFWLSFQPFLIIAVPNLLFVSALLFAIGALTRRLFAVYVTGIVVLVVWQITQQIVGDLDKLRLASAIDPFGLTTVSVVTRYWSVAEKNRLLVPMRGALLTNRLIWIGVSLALFAVVAAVFRLRVQGGGGRRRRPDDAAAGTARLASLVIPAPTLRHDRSAWWRVALEQARFHFRFIVGEAPFLAISAIAALDLMVSAWYTSHPGDSVTWPVTASLIPALRSGALLFVVLIATLYGGELLWRERQLKADQLRDTMPAPLWVSFISKLLALFGAVCVMLLICVAGLMVMQLAQGYTHLQPVLYAQGLVIGVLPTAFAMAALAIGVHAIVNQKFVGHLIIIVYWVGSVVLINLGISYRLFQVGTPLSFTYSDMNGWGPFPLRLLVFAGYSLACCLGVAAIGYLVLSRGSITGWQARRRDLAARWQHGGSVAIAACAGVALLLAAVYFYNANVLNTYTGVRGAERTMQQWEVRYKPLAALPQPRILAVSLQQDFYPARRAAAWRGSLVAANHASRAIDTLFVALPPSVPVPADRYVALSNDGIVVDSIGIDRASTLIDDDTPRGVRLYRLATPLQPGDSLTLTFALRFDPHGFPNGAFNQDATYNGSFMSSQYLPRFGYDPNNELSDDDIRARNGLQPKARMKALDDPTVRDNSYISGDADWIAFDETACTSADQIAIAPGYLVHDSTANGRRCLRYVMDRPILDFTTTLSARYVVDSERYHGVELAVYHIPAHAFAIRSMLRAAEDGLDYYGANFSPYQYRQYRIIEFPEYQTFAESFPNTVPYSEAIGFLYRANAGDDRIDWAYFVTAHELAHQWWAHQVVGGDGQGATMLSESLAEYSALTLMEKRYGPEATQKFLRRELDGYLQGRSVERKKEVPLMYVENQPYIHYRKGSLCLYALRDYIGEPAMNQALHSFLARWAFKGPPYPTSRDLVAEFDKVTPDSLKYVLRDLFEEMTFYDNKADSAIATPRSDGKYAVHLVVRAQKLKGDSLGNTRDVPIADYVDIGVFGAPVAGQKLGERLLIQKVHLTEPVTTFDFVVDKPPRQAGVDPYNILIDRTPEDNVMAVSIRK
jgi:hypothetical protein